MQYMHSQQQHYQRLGHLSELAHLLLVQLVNGPEYIAVLREAIERMTDLSLEPAALYRVVAQLERRGWIESESKQHIPRYAITEQGLLALQRAEEERSQHRHRQQQERHAGWRREELGMARLGSWMLRLYPPRWRERYEEEMLALLEQHKITLWTILDLLMGALDARLDPHYRLPRTPLFFQRRVQSSWRLLGNAMAAFWLVSLFWISINDVGGQYSPNGPGVLLALAVPMFFSAPLLVPLFVGWIGWKASKNAWHLLRFPPLAVFVVLLTQLNRSLTSQNIALTVVLVLAMALVAETGGAMLAPLLVEDGVISLLGLIGVVVMAASCLMTWFFMLADWDLFARLQANYVIMQPNPAWQPMLAIQFAVTALTVIIALFALTRGFFALRAARAFAAVKVPGVDMPFTESSSPDQPSQCMEEAPEPPQPVTERPAQLLREKTSPWIWVVILPMGMGLAAYAMPFVFGPGPSLQQALTYILFAGIGTLLIAIAAKLLTRKAIVETEREGAAFHKKLLSHLLLWLIVPGTLLTLCTLMFLLILQFIPAWLDHFDGIIPLLIGFGGATLIAAAYVVALIRAIRWHQTRWCVMLLLLALLPIYDSLTVYFGSLSFGHLLWLIVATLLLTLITLIAYSLTPRTAVDSKN